MYNHNHYIVLHNKKFSSTATAACTEAENPVAAQSKMTDVSEQGEMMMHPQSNAGAPWRVPAVGPH